MSQRQTVFHELSNNEFNTVKRLAGAHQYRAGERIFTEGDPADSGEVYLGSVFDPFKEQVHPPTSLSMRLTSIAIFRAARTNARPPW